MTSTSEAGGIADVIDSLDRTSFSAQHVRVGDYSTFQQIQNINVNPLSGGDAPSVAPRKINDIPDLLSPYFLGRSDELDQIRSSFANVSGDGCPRCVIYGMPGLGKTQLALKYADEAYRESWYPFLFWISATSEEKFVNGYSRILDLIGFPGRSEVDTDARCTAARGWLESIDLETKRRWLIVLDNARIESVAKMRQLLPRHNQSGHVLITTRTQQTAEQVATSLGKRYPCIGLGKLSAADAQELLLSRSDISQDQLDDASLKAASEIVKLTARLPLAVFQAASYMGHSGQTLHEILDLYRKERDKSVDLSTYEGESLQGTYSIALKELKKRSPSTVELLRILVFLDPEQISVRLLRSGGSYSLVPTVENQENALAALGPNALSRKSRLDHAEGKRIDEKAQQAAQRIEVYGSPQNIRAVRSLETLLRDEVGFNQAVQELQSLSIVARQRTSSGASLWLHDLVQEVQFSELMEKESERRFWLSRAIQLVLWASARFWDVHKNFEIWDDIAVQIVRLKAHAEKEKVQSLVLCHLCDHCAYFCTLKFNFDVAIMLQEWASDQAKAIVGVDHIGTQVLTITLGRIYEQRGDFDKAEGLLLEALKTQNQQKADDSARTAKALVGLGWLYVHQRRPKDGEKLYANFDSRGLETLPFEEQVEYYRVLAQLHMQQGKLEEAEVAQVQAIDIANEAYGDRSLTAGQCIEFLATIYQQQLKYEEAERKYLQAGQIFDKVGASSRDAKLSMENNLATLYMFQGKWYEARALLERVSETRAKYSPPDHPQSLPVASNLAVSRYELDEQDDAIDMMREVARMQSKVFGPHHPSTQDSLKKLEAWEQKRHDDVNRDH